MKKVAIAGAVLALTGSAQAADLLVKAPPPDHFSWAGFYAGANAGYAWGTTTTTDTVATNGLCWVRCGAQWDTAAKGVTGGVQAGYNWQFGYLVLGVEG